MKRIFIVLVLCIGFMSFLLYFVTSEAASELNFAKIENGMLQAEVLNLLGEPNKDWDGTTERASFFYGGFRRLKWCSMEIFFNKDGRVQGKFHDH